ncbi:Hypothetical predicted protein [Octopus vulgaris]|uniref:Uncharacterized protein n=1 Tax=Octopus vulgaris TaxID=6645 RepID=A0AA36FFQ2_OCTVU|nr:Hypothetical predicted protein [Octopus vulgaris]
MEYRVCFADWSTSRNSPPQNGVRPIQSQSAMQVYYTVELTNYCDAYCTVTLHELSNDKATRQQQMSMIVEVIIRFGCDAIVWYFIAILNKQSS